MMTHEEIMAGLGAIVRRIGVMEEDPLAALRPNAGELHSLGRAVVLLAAAVASHEERLRALEEKR